MKKGLIKALALLSVLLPLGLYAQDIKVSGTVVDNEGQPLLGAYVIRYDASKTKVLESVMADIDGKYCMTASQGDILEYSFIGYEKKEEKVGAKALIDVVLFPDAALKLEESVVIGYGSVQRGDLTGSVTNVRVGDINDVTHASVDAALQGRVAGMDVMTTTGEPGASASIRVRGTRSISASNEPLIVVDGVMDAVNDLNDINPSDIEDITILKDASSTAIYGSRGSNGVILITTKSGNGVSGKKVNLNVKITGGFSQLPAKLDLMNATEFALYRNEYLMNTTASYRTTASSAIEKSLIADPFSYGAGTDWIDEVTRTAPLQDYYIAANGTPAKGTNYFVSFAYMNNQGIIKRSGVERYIGRVNFSQQFFNWLKFSYKLNYVHHNRDMNLIALGGTNLSSGAIYLSPIIKPTDNYNPIYYSGEYINTPVALLENNIYDMIQNSTTHTVQLEAKPLPELKLNAQFSYNLYERQSYQYYPSTLPKKKEEEGGEAYRGNEEVYKLNFEASATYDKTWNKTHHLDAVAVFTGYSYNQDLFSLRGFGYLIDSNLWNNMGAVQDKNTYSASTQTSHINKMSAVARINYNYKKRYYLTVNGRYDGASNFAANKKWGFFPSMALKWNLSQEDWLKNAENVDELSIRASVGQTGNDAITAYLSNASMSSSSGGYLFNNQQPVSYYPGRIDNKDLTWETTTAYNIALKGAFFNGRLTTELEGYYSKTDDLLLEVKSGEVTGYSKRWANLGATSNAGVELSISSRNIVKKNFSWDTQFTISHNRQRVLDIGSNEYVSTYSSPAMGGNTYMMYGYVKGYPLNSLWGFKYAGVWHNQEEIERNQVTHSMASINAAQTKTLGMPRYHDINHDGVLDMDDLCYLGNADPVIYGGLNNTFRYKNLKMTLYFTYSVGGKIYNFSEFYMAGGQFSNQYRYMLNAWSEYRNPTSDLPRAGYYGIGAPSDFMVHDASYLRLQDLSVTYNIPLGAKAKKYISSLAIMMNASNVFLLKNYNGFDPDVSSEGASSTLRRIDLGAYPRARRVNFAIQIKY